MANKTMAGHSRRRAGNSVPPSTRLLPIPTEIVNDVMIKHHVMLSNLRRGGGDAHHFGSLARVIVVAAELLKSGYGEVDPEDFAGVQEALVRANEVAHATGVWSVDEPTSALLGDLLTLHEQQLRTAPLHIVAKANDRACQIDQPSQADRTDLRKVA
ncbi:hypothetical protein R70006_06216 [Paraburkholderia domus]|uniref:hypothetical protein n=1 Tax=Paraburkholderia domus TaxID=2793075 RepID=UPI001911FBC4|nr:hypothetical protein [Paraburkholderia domus]MBK5052848.1 hypothetical protein [Burkholderia sp. R-70006]CAE6821403.1 hypothetical protein R70006_06216 [Paraburkholderia domus]